MISAAEFEMLVRRSLEHGVPTSVVAEVFMLTEPLVRQAKQECLVAEYGTADQAEYLDWLEWKTLQRCHAIVTHGTPAEVSKVATNVLGRQIARRSKMTGETQRQAAEALMHQMEEMRSGPRREAEPSKFVVRAEEDTG